jgi:hypothetical protein
MMTRARHRDQRLDLGYHALLDVALTEVPAVGKDSFGTTEFFGQPLQLLDHRQQLLFVVGRLRDICGYDERGGFFSERTRPSLGSPRRCLDFPVGGMLD